MGKSVASLLLWKWILVRSNGAITVLAIPPAIAPASKDVAIFWELDVCINNHLLINILWTPAAARNYIKDYALWYLASIHNECSILQCWQQFVKVSLPQVPIDSQSVLILVYIIYNVARILSREFLY